MNGNVSVIFLKRKNSKKNVIPRQQRKNAQKKTIILSKHQSMSVVILTTKHITKSDPGNVCSMNKLYGADGLPKIVTATYFSKNKLIIAKMKDNLGGILI